MKSYLKDNTNRFDGKGDLYAKARPKYANELLDYMKRTLNVSDNSVFADIGSGTGVFTEQLLNCGYHVYAVEPNADMRKKRKKNYTAMKNFILLTALPMTPHYRTEAWII